MIEIVPFLPEHFVALQAPATQRAWVEENAAALAQGPGDARTALLDGRPIACAGVIELWPGRGYAWALLDRSSGRHMLPITRAVRGFLDSAPWRRVEMAVDAKFLAGCRWADLLGFVRETPAPMRAFAPNGADCFLYARVR